MSFDTEFDYTNHIAKCDNRIAGLNSVISDLNAELTELATVTGYDDYVANQTNLKNNQKSRLQDQIAKLYTVKFEINTVIGLSASEKQTLYDFYVASGDRKDRYMLRMLYNYADLIADATPLLADGALSAEMKKSIGQSICIKYPITHDANLVIGVKLPEVEA